MAGLGSMVRDSAERLRAQVQTTRGRVMGQFAGVGSNVPGLKVFGTNPGPLRDRFLGSGGLLSGRWSSQFLSGGLLSGTGQMTAPLRTRLQSVRTQIPVLPSSTRVLRVEGAGQVAPAQAIVQRVSSAVSSLSPAKVFRVG